MKFEEIKARLDAKFERYQNAGFKHSYYSGWHQNDCDALLFECLRGCVQGEDLAQIDAAYDGRWNRKPIAFKPKCYNPDAPINRAGLFKRLIQAVEWKLRDPKATLESIRREVWWQGSTISRDMLVGLAWYAYYNDRLDISEGVIKYALKHGGIMGSGDPTRTWIGPALLATFAWVSYRLGGPSRPWLRWIKIPDTKLDGFRAHLQVLHVGLREILNPKLDIQHPALDRQWRRQPLNALFAAMRFHDGPQERQHFYDLLDVEQLWPSDRLPTTADRHESWVFQRDLGDDWKPSDIQPVKMHPGSDFLFCYALLAGRLKK